MACFIVFHGCVARGHRTTRTQARSCVSTHKAPRVCGHLQHKAQDTDLGWQPANLTAYLTGSAETLASETSEAGDAPLWPPLTLPQTPAGRVKKASHRRARSKLTTRPDQTSTQPQNPLECPNASHRSNLNNQACTSTDIITICTLW